MKKLLAILLVCVFAFSVVACGGDGEESSQAGFQTSGTTSQKEESSKPAEESSKPADESSEADTSVESSEPVVEEADVIQFISWKGPFYNNIQAVRDTDATSLELKVINEEVPEGANGAFNFLYGDTVEVGADYAAFTFTYDHSVWGYVRSDYAAAGEDKEVTIPEDGFVAVVSKDNNDKIEAINGVTETTVFYPHGFDGTDGLDATILKAETAPTIDGKVDAAEYGIAIWEIDPESEYFSYAQFEVNNYNATGEVFMTYDADYLYVGIVIDSPDHYCTGNTNDLWKETAVQLNVGSASPSGDYMFDHWFQDNNNGDPANQEAYNSNRYRQYTVAYNADAGEEVTMNYFVINGVDNKIFKGSREGQITTYEVAIPWSDMGTTDEPVVVEPGTEIGVGLSINSGDAETAAANKLQTIAMRDGGGVIGVIDLSKTPTITLG